MYSDYAIDAARAKGLRYDPRNAVRFTASGRGRTPSAWTNSKATRPCSRDSSSTVSMRGWYPNTGDGHHHFFETFSYLGSAKRTQAQVLAEIVRRNRYQNVNYRRTDGRHRRRRPRSKRFFEAFQGLDPDDLPGSLAPYEPLINDVSTSTGRSRSMARSTSKRRFPGNSISHPLSATRRATSPSATSARCCAPVRWNGSSAARC